MYILQCLDRIDANVLASHLDDHIDRYVATNIALQGSTVTRHAAVSIRDAIAADHANVPSALLSDIHGTLAPDSQVGPAFQCDEFSSQTSVPP